MKTMKMKYVCLFIIVMMMMFPVVVDALTDEVVLKCDDTSLSSGQRTNCTLNGQNFNTTVSSFHAEIILDEGLKLYSSSVDSSWEGSSSGGIIDLYTDVNKTGNMDFVTFVIEASDVAYNVDKTITINNIIIGDSNFKENNLENVILSIKLISNASDSSNSDNNDDQNKVNNSEENNYENNVDDGFRENPKTGSHMFIGIIVAILLFSLGFIIYYKNRIECKKEW